MTPHEALMSEIEQLDADQAELVLRFVKTLKPTPKDEYDEANDPTVAVVHGPTSPDLASRTREILEAEFGKKESGTNDE